MLMGALLLLTPMFAVLPAETALAATCINYHVVKSGDKTGAIAHTYNLTWEEIAKANNLGIDETPKVGDRLCIPKSKAATTAARLATLAQGFTPTYNSGRISFPLATLADGVWKVKVRDANAPSGGWTQVNRLDTSTAKGSNFSVKLPSSLISTPRVEVCLKNAKTDKQICKIVLKRAGS